MLWKAWEESTSLQGLLPRAGLGAAPWFKIIVLSPSTESAFLAPPGVRGLVANDECH